VEENWVLPCVFFECVFIFLMIERSYSVSRWMKCEYRAQVDSCWLGINRNTWRKNCYTATFFLVGAGWDWTQAFTVNSKWLTPSDIMCVYFWCVEVHICGDKWNLFPENWGIFFEVLNSNKAEATTVWWEVMYPVSTIMVEEQEMSLFIFPALCMQSTKSFSKCVQDTCKTSNVTGI